MPPTPSLLQKRLGTTLARGQKATVYEDVFGEDRYSENMMQRRVLPGHVERIMVNAINGDLSDQQAFFNHMLDTWPRLQHNVTTKSDAVKSAPWEVHAYVADDGKEASAIAQEKAALVTRAMWGMRPDAPKRELGFEDCVAGMTRGTVTGHCVQEILWEVREDAAGPAVLPRAIRRTSSVYYGYPSWYLNAFRNQSEDYLHFRTDRLGNQWKDFPENQFLVGIFPGHDGHPSVAGPLRSLAKYWLAATYGPEWLMSYAQLFGQPFRWATYKDVTAKAAVVGMLANIGAQGYGAFPEGTTLNLVESSKGAGELPQKLIIDIANQACDILILGQTLSSDNGDGKGSFALGKVHATVRREKLSTTCGEIAKLLTQQFARSVIELNYGECTECPEIRCVLPEPEDQKANAETDTLLAGLGVVFPKQYMYDRYGVPIPEDGEEILEAPEPAAVVADPEKEDPVKAAQAKKDAMTVLGESTDALEMILTSVFRKAWEDNPIDLTDITPARKKP